MSEIVDSCLGKGAAYGPGAVATCINEHKRLLRDVQRQYKKGVADLRGVFTQQENLLHASSAASKESKVGMRSSGKVFCRTAKRLSLVIKKHEDLFRITTTLT